MSHPWNEGHGVHTGREQDAEQARTEDLEATADAIGDASPPEWVGASRSNAQGQPQREDEFDVRLRRGELHLLAGLLQTMGSNDTGGVAIDYFEDAISRGQQFQAMLDNPFGGWVERAEPPVDVHRPAATLRATLARCMGPGSVAVFDQEMIHHGLDKGFVAPGPGR